MKKNLIDKLYNEHSLKKEEYLYLLSNRDSELMEYAKEKAVDLRCKVYGKSVYIRGLIEISNYCKNDCLYCGIRKSNTNCERYRLSKEEILSCCDSGYMLGFRTFVMQGGEDMHFSDDIMCDIIKSIKEGYPDCAITLSLGERGFESYKRMFDAGADRYLLRHETADYEHYKKLHPEAMSYEKRIENLKHLKEIGYQVGCGFMVGSPYQKDESIADDLKFIEEFSPDMCGIGPFIPHKDTPFKDYPSGDIELTLFLLSLIRLIKPNILLPSTTALGTISKNGRERGILYGANVVMPNLSPVEQRGKYELYNNKLSTGAESAESLDILKESIKNIGYEVVTHRGDIIVKGENENGKV